MSEKELKQELMNQAELETVDISTKASEYEIRSTY